ASIPDDWDGYFANLADFRWVHISVDNLRVWCEGVNVTGDAVIETRTDSNQQICALHGGNRWNRAVHARHTHVLWVRIRESTQSHQGGNHWDAGKFGKLQQLAVSISLDDTATDVENRAGSFRNHLHRGRDLAVVRIRRWLVARHVELRRDRKSTRLNSSHVSISYAVFCRHRALHSFPTRRSSDLVVTTGMPVNSANSSSSR